jgi:hypothetical protein
MVTKCWPAVVAYVLGCLTIIFGAGVSAGSPAGNIDGPIVVLCGFGLMVVAAAVGIAFEHGLKRGREETS